MFAQDNSGDNSVSHALEYYVADNALSLLAADLGHKQDAQTFRQRSPEEELFFTYFRKPERFDTPQYLTASDIMTKLSVFTRITPTRSNIVTLSKVLKKHGFKLTKTRGKLLFEVAEITSEQVKANFLRPRQEEEDRAQKENDIFKGQEDKPE